MIKRRNKKNNQGQTALIMILLAAAALIFLSISLNWTRIAQTKSLLTIASDQSASLLASDVASYGEMEKQTNLKDKNELSELSGIIMDVILVVVIIIVIIVEIISWGGLTALSAGAITALTASMVALAVAVATLALTLAVIQPGICAMWNKLQKDQPIQQQFYEGGIGQALSGSITDQVNITDYFDDNTNGVYGTKLNIPNDTISRFAFFYTDRLKMLNKGEIPQVVFFYNQLTEFMNGETCYQNFIDSGTTNGKNSTTGIALNPSCIDTDPGDINYGIDYCGSDPSTPSTDPACQSQVPNVVTCAQNAIENSSNPSIPLNSACPSDCISNPADPSCQWQISNPFSFQLNDPCTDSDPTVAATYNPYCDACCQPMVQLVSPATSGNPAAYKSIRPSSCYPSTYPNNCFANPTATGCACTTNPNDPSCALPSGECTTNNPYNPYGSYPYIYDPTYQEYSNGTSFLDQFGRDEQFVPPGNPLPLTSILSLGNFPNGIYPFFWLMENYSPEVDNINPATTSVTVPQDHWCVAGSTMAGGAVPSTTPPTGFPDLTQLGSSYTDPATGTTSSFLLPACQGGDCCVNFLPDSIANVALATSASITIKVTGPAVLPKVSITSPASGKSYVAGGILAITATATETAPGSIQGVTFQIIDTTADSGDLPMNLQGTATQSGNKYSLTAITIPTDTPPGVYNLTATATDDNSNSTISNPVSITITAAPPPPPPPPAGTGTGIGAGSFVSKSFAAKADSVSATTDAVTSTGTGGGAQTITVTSPNGNKFTSGANITLDATISGIGTGSVVEFYHSNPSNPAAKAVLIGASTSAPYSYTWNNVPAGNYTITAVLTGTDNVGASTTNGAIDMVQSPSFVTNPYSTNPAKDQEFGKDGSGSWLAGDNQMCTAGWPYNGGSTKFPDGSCEWTGTAITASNTPSSLSINPNSTLDDLDDTMHTFSAFVKFSQSLLDKDLGTINSTFDTWYGQAAGWIAPACPSSGTCNGDSDTSSFEATSDLFDQQCNSDSSTVSCNQGGDGRLLSIYDPKDYPGVTGVTSNTVVVDKLKDWNTLISKWLNNSYTPSGATSSTVWCVPSEAALGVGTSEDTYINTNAATTTWGDLPHVISCLNYNAGSSQMTNIPNASKYQSCLTALTSGTCPGTLPDVCASSILGYPSSVTPPTFSSTDTTRCEAYKTGSYANWVSNNINFGPAYNYQTCLNLLTNSCPTSAGLSGTACDPLILGRSIIAGAIPAWVKSNTHRCDPTFAGSYAQWVGDNVTLFSNESSKFALRSAFLTDVYTRAQTLQSITAQADTALHNFLKPCTDCADGSTCPAGGGQCADGSACGSPLGKCENGGPAAQLIYAHTQSSVARTLPNSVIYGWVDKTLPNGRTLPRGTGYAHIVKVTAYSPGRDGNGTANLRGLQPRLPWIHSWTTFLYQKYGLANRDGNVYVSIIRWDEDHTTATLFPNGHPVWQFMFHNPTTPPVGGDGSNPLIACDSTYQGMVTGGAGIGFGLEATTVQGLIQLGLLSQQDRTSLANAFMLNDKGDSKGSVDDNARLDSNGYSNCLITVKPLLAVGTESHACARYVASLGGNDPSGNGDGDYSLKFIDCNSIDSGAAPQSNP